MIRCPKCKTTLKCNGVSDKYQEWYCPVCGYQKSVLKNPKKYFYPCSTNSQRGWRRAYPTGY